MPATPSLESRQFQDTTFIILAGGKGRRFNDQDKGLLPVRGKPVIEYLLTTLHDLEAPIMISANRHIDIYQQYGFPVIPDHNELLFWGPLAGLCSCATHIRTEKFMMLPCDLPLIAPENLAELHQGLEDYPKSIVVPHDGFRRQHGILHGNHNLVPSIHNYLLSGGRSIKGWLDRQTVTEIRIPPSPHALSPFFNLNTPEALQQLEDFL